MTSNQLAWYVDLRGCTGCRTCQIACQDDNDLPAGVAWRRVEEVAAGDYEVRGEALMPHVRATYVPVACNHCLEPACAAACPVGAIVKRPADGLVLIDEAACLGCGDCADACPYESIQINPATGLASKCDFCADHIAAGRPPICVSACPMRVLDWGPLADLQARYGMLADVPPLPGDAIRRPALVITPHPLDTACWSRCVTRGRP
ncbi:MAG: 4Fe-4S binding protein [Chloroflexi bacterium]|nr:4Fe-4S binding protein [Chloroflexota bacterium]